MAAYLLEQQSYEPEDRLEPYIAKSNTLDCEAFQRWVAIQKPEAILGLPMFWPGVEQWKHFLAGLPEHIEWIHLDVITPAGSETGIYQNHEKIGASAVDLLVRLVELNQRGPLERSETLLIEGSWIEGKRRNRAGPDTVSDLSERPMPAGAPRL